MNNTCNKRKVSPAAITPMDSAAEFSVLQVKGEEKEFAKMMVAREFPLTIILNGQELVTLLCTPENLEYLAVGYLFAEGLVESKAEIKKVLVDEKHGVVRIDTPQEEGTAHELLYKRLITSACGRGAAFYTAADARHPSRVESIITVSLEEVLALVKEFDQRSEMYHMTNGVHSAALCDNKNILVFSNDLGRHNAIDKVFGECILKGISTQDRMVITSGRTPSEMLLKVAKGNIPVLISVSVPTDLGIRLANDLGITIIGFVRGDKMNVYTGRQRISGDSVT